MCCIVVPFKVRALTKDEKTPASAEPGFFLIGEKCGEEKSRLCVNGRAKVRDLDHFRRAITMISIHVTSVALKNNLSRFPEHFLEKPAQKVNDAIQ
jgi:hypothetical protein